MPQHAFKMAAVHIAHIIEDNFIDCKYKYGKLLEREIIQQLIFKM